MKTISLWQPWAELIACGAKRIETRSWETNYRGPIAIHAAKRWTRDEQDMVKAPRFRAALLVAAQQGIWDDTANGELPLGCVVALATLRDCVPMSAPRFKTLYHEGLLTEWERDFGHYGPGRFAWVLDNVVALKPIPARGAQGLFDWEPPARLESMPLIDLQAAARKREAILRMLAHEDPLHADGCAKRDATRDAEGVCTCGVREMSDFIRSRRDVYSAPNTPAMNPRPRVPRSKQAPKITSAVASPMLPGMSEGV